jgi:hypothetical protein
MPTLQSLLAVYGSIDEIVRADPDTRAPVAARYLPSYRDRSAPGWYREIQALAERHRRPDLDDDAQLVWPSLPEAIADLADPEEPLTLEQVGKLTFAIGVLAQIDPAREMISDDDLLLAARLALPEEVDDVDAAAARLLADLSDPSVFASRDDWDVVIRNAVEGGYAHEALTMVSAPCLTGTVRYGNTRAAELTTNHTATYVSFDAVLGVLDPLNWDDCYPSFFCSMAPLAPNNHGWSQVLETIGVPCWFWTISTGLKYWKGQTTLTSGLRRAHVNYRLCDTRPPGDSDEIVVDSGYIVVHERPDGDGVDIRTSKQIAFRTTSLTAVAYLACIMGWAEAGGQLIPGCAWRQDGYHPWEPNAATTTGTTTTGTTTAGERSPAGAAAEARQRPGPSPIPGPGGGGAGPVPPGTAGAMIDAAVGYTNACIQESSATAGVNLNVASQGAATADQLAAWTASTMLRLWLEPIRLLGMAMAATTPPTPPTPPAPDQEETPT